MVMVRVLIYFLSPIILPLIKAMFKQWGHWHTVMDRTGWVRPHAYIPYVCILYIVYILYIYIYMNIYKQTMQIGNTCCSQLCSVLFCWLCQWQSIWFAFVFFFICHWWPHLANSKQHDTHTHTHTQWWRLLANMDPIKTTASTVIQTQMQLEEWHKKWTHNKICQSTTIVDSM